MIIVHIHIIIIYYIWPCVTYLYTHQLNVHRMYLYSAITNDLSKLQMLLITIGKKNIYMKYLSFTEIEEYK